MNTLEDRVRAAVRARAREITPDRIRPLDLTGASPGGAPPLAGTARRRWRWAAPIAAAAAVAAVAAVLASVSGGHDRGPKATGTSPAGAAHPSKHRPASSPLTRNLSTEVLGLYLPATGPQYAAGTQLEGTFKALQLVVTARCLAKAGVQVQRLSVANLAPRYAANYPDNSQFPDLASISRTHAFVPGTFPVGLRPVAGERQAFKRNIGRCQAAATAMFSPLDSASQRLASAWFPLIGQAQTAAPVRATLGRLRSCATRYGWPADPYGPPATSIRSFSDFGDWVFGHLDGAGTRGASPATMRRLDRHWSVIFVRCGRPTLAAQDRWLAARQAGFIRQHEQQLRALEALARRIIQRAAGTGG
jgi:hypothetical protein